MHKIAPICFLFFSLGIFAQKKIFYYKASQGVIYSDTSHDLYTENQKKYIIKEFEDAFQIAHPEFNEFVRQYDIDFFNKKAFLYVRLIPMEKSYQYGWRYHQYIGRENDVRLVSYDIEGKTMSGVDWTRVEE